MEARKPFKYYAIRVVGSVVIRRTIGTITAVHSKLYKPGSQFICEQITYTGGKAIGATSYLEWRKYGGAPILLNKCVRITREQYRAISPFLQKGED